jgi:hypothetical protein
MIYLLRLTGTPSDQPQMADQLVYPTASKGRSPGVTREPYKADYLVYLSASKGRSPGVRVSLKRQLT